MTDQLKFVYICGLGHNGSTSLDLLLDLSPRFTGTSQLNDLLVPYDPRTLELAKQQDRDRFWIEVLNRMSDDQKRDLEFQNSSIGREKALLPLFFFSKRRKSYALANEVLIDLLSEKVGPDQVIVDSSKNVARCIGLSASKYDVRVIHLIRDVRGFVGSHNKRRIESGLKPDYLKPTLLWFAKNIAASVMARFRSKKIVRVSYEDYMFAPDQFLKTLSDFLDEPLDDCRPGLMGDEALKPDMSLGFSGNRVLHNRKQFCLDRNRVRADGIYKSSVYWILLGWPAMIWGYRFRRQHPKKSEA